MIVMTIEALHFADGVILVGLWANGIPCSRYRVWGKAAGLFPLSVPG